MCSVNRLAATHSSPGRFRSLLVSSTTLQVTLFDDKPVTARRGHRHDRIVGHALEHLHQVEDFFFEFFRVAEGKKKPDWLISRSVE